MSFESHSDGSNTMNRSWIWILIALALIAGAAGSHGSWGWWVIFPLFFWIIPMIRHSMESPEERAARFEARVERRRMKLEYKAERYRARHPELFAAQMEQEKRKNDADSLDELVEEKRKNNQNPRYVLIGDGEIMQVEGDEPDAADDDPPMTEDEPRRFHDDGYV